MNFIRHALIAACYGTVALVTALTLPGIAAVPSAAAIAIGGTIFAMFAILHEVFARQETLGRFSDEIGHLRRSHGEVERELNAARGEMSRLHQTLEARGRGISDAAYDALAAEVKVLQDLVESLSTEKDDAAKGRPIGDDRASGTLPVARDLDDEGILSVVRDGLRADRIDLYLQPIVNLPQRQRRYYEAYTRIRDGEGKIVLPDQYIAIAEREGLITAIDNMLLFRCVQLVRKSQRSNQNVGIFCNVSPHTLADRVFFRDFVEFMARNTELAPDMIFEFPQATIVGRDAELDQALARLSSIGFRFSMDQVNSFRFDFDWMNAHRFKFVKLDAASLAAQIKEPTAQTSMRSMKRHLRTSGVNLIAEKVESESVLLELLDFQIDYGQGYLFGEPRRAKAA